MSEEKPQHKGRPLCLCQRVICFRYLPWLATQYKNIHSCKADFLYIRQSETSSSYLRTLGTLLKIWLLMSEWVDKKGSEWKKPSVANIIQANGTKKLPTPPLTVTSEPCQNMTISLLRPSFMVNTEFTWGAVQTQSKHLFCLRGDSKLDLEDKCHLFNIIGKSHHDNVTKIIPQGYKVNTTKSNTVTKARTVTKISQKVTK